MESALIFYFEYMYMHQLSILRIEDNFWCTNLLLYFQESAKAKTSMVPQLFHLQMSVFEFWCLKKRGCIWYGWHGWDELVISGWELVIKIISLLEGGLDFHKSIFVLMLIQILCTWVYPLWWLSFWLGFYIRYLSFDYLHVNSENNVRYFFAGLIVRLSDEEIKVFFQ